MISWLLPTIIIVIIWASVCLFTLACCVASARADRRAADEQELRDVDAWLERMWEA
jgi:hypothetical protein